jgi:peptidoglycan-associated lipoprotein
MAVSVEMDFTDSSANGTSRFGLSPMKTHTLLSALLMGVLSAAGCHKANPVATISTPPAPAAMSQPKPAPPASAPVAKSRPAPAPVRTNKPTVMTAQERETLNQSLSRLSDALFDYNSANVRSDAAGALSADVRIIRDILAGYPHQMLIVEGGADERGSAEFNLALGDRRARAVQAFLTQTGIPGNQLTMISFGKEKPVCEEHTESCWQRNRRAHITAEP